VYTSNHEFGPDEQKSLDIVVVAVFQPALNKVSRMKQESIQTMMIKHHLATPVSQQLAFIQCSKTVA